MSYVPSAGVLRHCLVRRSAGIPRRTRQDAVIVADAGGRQPLPLARDQALALGAMLSSQGWHVRCRMGQDAALAALEGDVGAATALGLAHFAVHGFTAPDDGLDSGLRLADSTLTARRLLRMRFDGALVCMGACDTGLSERLAGDELLGLVRSALQVGAGAVLASLWPVDQLSSSMLLLDFHQRLLDGQPKADALRAAQLRLRCAPVSDVLTHLAGTRRRLAGDSRALAAAALTEARLRLAAGDGASALAAADVLADGDRDDAQTREAAEIRERARLAARQAREPDYTRRPFAATEHWAPFILIGDPA